MDAPNISDSSRALNMSMPNRQPLVPLTSSLSSLKRQAPEPDQFMKRLRSGGTMSPTLPAKQSTFPYYEDGDVIITMSDGKRERVWRLDKATLESRSPRLKSLFASADANTLLVGKENSEEATNIQPSRLSVRYFLTPEPGHHSTTPLLVAKPLNEIPGHASASGNTSMEIASSDSPGQTPGVSQMTGSEMMKKSGSSSPSPQVPRHAADAFVAYNCLFSSFYNRQLPLNTSNVLHALHGAEHVLALASKYACMDAIRPHIGNVLSQFRRRLFEAIAQDPPRWLNLSILLESAMIFTEAFIHIVSSPAWPWQTTETHVNKATLPLIKEKKELLHRSQKEVIERLLRNAILEDNRPINDMRNNLETWLTIQVFRDWLVSQLHMIEIPNHGAIPDPPKSHVINGDFSSGIGALFRQIFRGGDALLPYDKVLRELKEAFDYMNLEWEDLADDLRLLKDHAREIVRDMCKNNLMIDPELHQISYLTCTEVDAKDFPWSATEATGSW